MANSYSVVAKLSADVGGFTKGMATASASLSDFTKKTKQMNLKDAFKGAGQVISQTGKALSLGVTLPLVGLATAAVKTGMEFEKQMNRVSAISGATGKDLEKLEKQAIDLGASSIFGATEVAESQEMLASAGLTVNEILAATPGIMDLAAVSGGDMALASEAAATAMKQFGLDAKNSTHVADIFARAAADTNAETTDMAEALKYAGPVAGALGLTMEETAAAIGIMSNAGIKGSQAGTTMRGALTRLVKPTKKARDTMDELGLSFFDAKGEMLPFGEIVGMLQTKTKDLTSEQKQQAITTIFGQEAMSGMLALIGSAPGEFDALTDSLINSDGSAKAMAETMNSGLAGAIEEMQGALESAAIAISETLGPKIQDLALWIGDLVDSFNELTPEQQETIVNFGLLVAAVGPVLFIFGKLTSGISSLITLFAFFTTPIGLVVLAIVAVIAIGVLLYKNWDEIKAKLGELKDKFVADWNELCDLVTGVLTTLKDAFSQDFEEISTAVTDSGQTLKDAFTQDITELSTISKGAISTLKTAAISDFTQLSNGAKSTVSTLKTAAINDFNQLSTAGKNAMSTLRNSAVSDAQQLSSIAKGAVSTLRSKAVADFNQLKDGGIRAWNTLKSKTSEIFNSLKGIITGALNIDLFAAGKAIIDGFLRGLKSAYEGVKTFVGGIATWIKDNKGPISYDKKLLIGAGNAIMFGLNKGLEDDFSKVQSTVRGMAGSIQDTFNSSPSMDINGSIARSNAQVNSAVSHEINNAGKQPAYISLNLGGKNFDGFVDDISHVQNAKIQLTESYL